MCDRVKAIKGLEEISDYFFGVYHHSKDREEINTAKDRCDAVEDAIALLKEQEEAKWIYGEDKTGVDGWYCSECDFFEPWFYEFTDDIDFIRFYGYCPGCGRKMTSYTGKPTQSRR